MKRDVGLWIDRQKAVVVTVTHHGDGLRDLQPSLEKRVLFSGVVNQDGWAGNMQDRKFANCLTHYYDDVIACILGADSIQIFGPGEAKVQLEKRLRHEALGEHIVGIETVDKMSVRQIEARVWQHFLSNSL